MHINNTLRLGGMDSRLRGNDISSRLVIFRVITILLLTFNKRRKYLLFLLPNFRRHLIYFFSAVGEVFTFIAGEELKQPGKLADVHSLFVGGVYQDLLCQRVSVASAWVVY